MRLVGLTGNIAVGKSTVLQLLRELGAEVVDADALVHELMRPGTPTTEAVVEAFGEGVRAENGGVDRRALAAIVFNDPASLRLLEQIVHPAVGTEIRARIEAARSRRNPPPAVVVEGVKIIESGTSRLMDQVWIVIAKPDVQRRRLIEQRGMSAAEADARLAAQPSLDRLTQADVIIENSGSLETLERQVRDAWRALMASEHEEGLKRA